MKKQIKQIFLFGLAITLLASYNVVTHTVGSGKKGNGKPG